MTQLKRAITRIKDWLERLSADHPVGLALLVSLTAFVCVIASSFPFYNQEFFENVLVEAHGVLLDLLVIGFLVFWLNSLGEKRREQKRYQEEIEDYLGWNEPEATYRIVGNIRRLNREGVSRINLFEANLSKAHLIGANLIGADLNGAHLSKADLIGAT